MKPRSPSDELVRTWWLWLIRGSITTRPRGTMVFVQLDGLNVRGGFGLELVSVGPLLITPLYL
ncbi:cyclosome subunit [Anopheles sinensis]|uniref:Cyclosome subunit n=1 Tax=Anopheles sinensis TaxID=74873 RepID=A0A084WGN6_ANOSI|nr:cyclosome subunit [Anopheles sinensis]